MRLKTFTATSIAEAMASARAELGDDAIIVATDKPPHGLARVVATPAAAESDPPPLPGRDTPARPAPAHVAECDDEIAAVLEQHGVVPAVVERLALHGRARIETLEFRLEARIAALFRFAPFDFQRQAAPILLLGPAGAGKSVTAAKLAAVARVAGRPCRLVTLDTWRAAGVEQLKIYADALRLPLNVANDAAMLAEAVAPRDDEGTLVIIDTPAIDVFSSVDRTLAMEWLLATRADATLVLPAGVDAVEARDVAAGFGTLGCMRLIAPRIDAARRIGTPVNAADAGTLALCAAGTSPRIVDGLVAFEPRTLARWLIKDPRVDRGATMS
jgi:flagellar biosynthesis protein FlhF